MNTGISARVGIYILVAVLLIMIGLVVYSSKEEEAYPDYSSFNNREKGIKALFILAGRMGFSTERFDRSARFLPDEASLVVIKPDMDFFGDLQERKYLRQWLERGNKLILAGSYEKLDEYYIRDFTGNKGVFTELEEQILIYPVGKGSLIVIDKPDRFTNYGLKKSAHGVVFISALDAAGFNKVFFGEYYHGIIGKGLTIWDLLGQSGNILVFQAFLALILFMYIKSRKFGKPVTVFEIVKRRENENLFALSNIYMKARANTAVLESYLSNFRKETAKFLGLGPDIESMELANACAGNKILTGLKVKEILGASEKFLNGGKLRTKQLVRLVGKIEKVRKELA